MESSISQGKHHIFSSDDPEFQSVSPQVAAVLASIGADITLLVLPDGTIRDTAFRDPDLEKYGLSDWPGKTWKEISTIECHDKIDSLLEENAKTGTTRRRQLNHAAPGMPDLPVDYRLITVDGMTSKIAVGEDQRKLSIIQQQLVQTQIELESEYRKIREAEGRYRTIFYKTAMPVLVVEGETGNLVDINLAATQILNINTGKSIGKSAHNLFERTSRPQIVEAMNAARHSGVVQTVAVQFVGISAPYEAMIEPYRENSRGNLIISLTERKDATISDAALFDNDNAILDSFCEALVVINRQGAISSVNEQFLDLIHLLNRSMVANRNLNNWLGASAVDMQVLMARVRDEGQIRQFSTVIRDELGVTKPVLVSAARYSEAENAPIGVFITENVKRESAFAVPSPDAEKHQSSDFSELVGRVPLKDLIREAVDVIEKMCIESALRQTENNRASAADMLGLSRQSLYIKLKRHDLEDFTGED